MIVAVVTSNKALVDAPRSVRIGMAGSGLRKASVVNVSQLVTLDRAQLTQRVRALPADMMRDIDDGLRLVLGIRAPRPGRLAAAFGKLRFTTGLQRLRCG